MSEPLKCIMINSRALRSLYSRVLTKENLRLIRGRINNGILSEKGILKIGRCFNERDFFPGNVILKEGEPLQSIFVIKRGQCEIYRNKNPLNQEKREIEPFFLKLPMAGVEMCLGLDRGSMSNSFNYFPLATVGPGSWIGEESFYIDDTNEL